MKLILVDPNTEICNAWLNQFEDYYNDVLIYNMKFQYLPVLQSIDYILVAAGNSFGVMGGGIDLEIARTFPESEALVRKKIHQLWNGELNVGATISIKLDSKKEVNGKNFSHLIYAPTMMAPIDIRYTQNVYLAMKAALQEYELLNRHSVIEDDPYLVVPGLGGGCGRVSSQSVARQMFLAYRNHIGKRYETTTIGMRMAYNEVYNASN